MVRRSSRAVNRLGACQVRPHPGRRTVSIVKSGHAAAFIGMVLLLSACAAPSPTTGPSAEGSAEPTAAASVATGQVQNGLIATFTITPTFRGLRVFEPVTGETRWQVPFDDFGSLAWSPDGTRLAVVTPTPTQSLTVYDVNGAGLMRLDGVWRAAWSPDSATIAVALLDGLALQPSQPETQLIPIGPRWTVADLVWTTDGSGILFSSTGTDFDPSNPPVGEPPRHLYRIDVANGSVSQLTDGLTIDHDLFVAPDGSRIAFKRTDPSTGGTEAFVTDVSGSPTALGHVGWAGNPWSPDSTRLLLSDQAAVWIATLDGEVVEVVAQPNDTLAPIGAGWSPDGAWLLIAWQATLGDLNTLEAVAVDSAERLDLGTGYGASWQPLP